MKEYAIQTRSLTVGYDRHPVIRDIAMDIRPGEIVALIGPNGAGKSTLLKSLAAQLRILSGAVEIIGQDLQSLPAREIAKKMAVVLTERTRPELITCREVVALGRYPHTGRLGILSGEDERQVDAAMAAVGAEGLAAQDFSTVSDGQRQRVLLARALCQQPRIIVLDEPTSFLDIRYKLELLDILRRMAREEGITVLMSLHEIDLAQKAADRVLCIREESVFLFGTPEEVFTGEHIRRLYGMEGGTYDPLFGSIELPRREGAPRVFILSSGGSGIPVYRALQREGVPFAAGILYENDIDYALARHLAAEVVFEKPFREISDPVFGRAKELVEAVPRVMDAGIEIGESNRRMAELIAFAKAAGKYERRTGA